MLLRARPVRLNPPWAHETHIAVTTASVLKSPFSRREHPPYGRQEDHQQVRFHPLTTSPLFCRRGRGQGEGRWPEILSTARLRRAGSREGQGQGARRHESPGREERGTGDENHEQGGVRSRSR